MKRKVTKVSKTSHRRPAKTDKLIAKASARKVASRQPSGGKSAVQSKTAARHASTRSVAKTEWGRSLMQLAGMAKGLPPHAAAPMADAPRKKAKATKNKATNTSRTAKKAAPRRMKKLTARTAWGRAMLEIAGIADGLPPDASINHDRYIYGTP